MNNRVDVSRLRDPTLRLPRRQWRPSRRWPVVACLLLFGLGIACGEPPDKEMQQARSAIEAARAAGADDYAAAEYQAAISAFQQAQDAVADRDYRVALNQALTSRERAENAARETADQKAAVRGEIERLMIDATQALAQGRDRLRALETARVEPRSYAPPKRALGAAEEALQKARTRFDRGEYLVARQELADISDRLRTVARELDAVPTTPPPRRRR